MNKKDISPTGKNLVLIVTFFFSVYMAIPILAPIFMKVGLTDAGRLIYTVYSYLCHQRAERALFLFGEKFLYNIEDFVGIGILDVFDSRNFIGNEDFGYKLAFCTRDLGIYTGLVAAGFYTYFNKKILKPLMFRQIVLGIAPLVIDGMTQFVAEITSVITWNSLVLMGSAEPFYVSSNPLRLLTGLLFGVTVGLWLYPSIIEEMK